MYAAYPIYKYCGIHFGWETFPEWSIVLRDLLFCVAFNDTLFYWGHRGLHHPKLYKYYHKQHHEFNHPIATCSEYAHFVEEILCNMIPTMGGPLIMGSHAYVLWFWVVLRIWKSCDAHCGFNLPLPFSIWNFLPGQLSTRMHDFHHEINTGQFGAMTSFWDTVCGTNASYNAYMEKEKGKRLERGMNMKKEAEGGIKGNSTVKEVAVSNSNETPGKRKSARLAK